MKYAYYPGCSLKGTGRAYEESLLAVFRALGVELEELEIGTAAEPRPTYRTVSCKSYALLPATFLLQADGPRPDGTLRRLLSGSEQDAALRARISLESAKLSIMRSTLSTFRRTLVSRFGTLSTSYSMMSV